MGEATVSGRSVNHLSLGAKPNCGRYGACGNSSRSWSRSEVVLSKQGHGRTETVRDTAKRTVVEVKRTDGSCVVDADEDGGWARYGWWATSDWTRS
jgi:hypothetical protein